MLQIAVRSCLRYCNGPTWHALREVPPLLSVRCPRNTAGSRAAEPMQKTFPNSAHRITSGCVTSQQHISRATCTFDRLPCRSCTLSLLLVRLHMHGQPTHRTASLRGVLDRRLSLQCSLCSVLFFAATCSAQLLSSRVPTPCLTVSPPASCPYSTAYGHASTYASTRLPRIHPKSACDAM